MKCPLCPNELVIYCGNLVKCSRSHRFYVEWASEGDNELKLVLAVASPDNPGVNQGEEFPVPNDATFAKQ